MSDEPGLVQLDDEGWIEGDFPCVRCGYNPRALTVDADCPECGAPVNGSLEEMQRWRMAALQAAARRAHGALWLIAADACALVLTFIDTNSEYLLAICVTVLLLIGAIVAGGIGLWNVCVPDVDDRGDGVRRLCFVVRASIVIAVCAMTMVMFDAVTASTIHIALEMAVYCPALFAIGGGMYVLTHAPARAPALVRTAGVLLLGLSIAAICFVLSFAMSIRTGPMLAKTSIPVVPTLLLMTEVGVLPLLWWCRRQIS